VNGGNDLRQLNVGAGFGFLDELEQYAAAQVIAALRQGDEIALNPDVLRFDKDEHPGTTCSLLKEPGTAVLKDLACLLHIDLVLALEYFLQKMARSYPLQRTP
jgi:hypothetical protein